MKRNFFLISVAVTFIVVLAIIITQRSTVNGVLPPFAEHLFCLSDGYLFYRNPDHGGRLYRMRTDGSENEKVTGDRSRFVYAANGWVYYRNDDDNSRLYRIRANGTDRQRLTDTYGGYIGTQGDWTYYYADESNGSNAHLYRINRDGAVEERVKKWLPVIAVVSEGSLYFVYGQTQQDAALYEISLDTGERVVLAQGIAGSVRAVDAGYVYVSSNNATERALYRVLIKGGAAEHLSSDVPYALYVEEQEGMLYYGCVYDGGMLYRMRMDGSGREKLGEEKTGGFVVADGWIYFSNAEDSHRLYKMKTDGSSKQRVKP